MKTSSPLTPKARQHKSILLIGPPGGGKTTLLLQFPNVWVADCDMNLDGPERHLRDQRKLPLTYVYDQITRDDHDQPLDISVCYDRLMTKLDEIKHNPEVSTVCIDSLTYINEFVIRKIMAAQKRNEMEPRDWIPFKTSFLNLLVGKIRSVGKDVICTVHENIIWSPDPKNIVGKVASGYEPSVQGSIVDYFGAFFTDVWRCESRPGPGNKPKFFLTTGRTSKSDLKNSCNLPFEIEDPTYEKLAPHLKL